MGFAAFADAPVEAAVVEVGLGGAWDATNVADGAVAVITPIGLDHAEYLGTDVLGHRAGEGRHHQAGRGGGHRPRRTRPWPQVLLERCVEVDAQVAREGAEFGVRRPRDRRRRPAAHPAGPSGTVRRDLPAAARRAPGGERGAGAGRGRGVLRCRAAAAASTPTPCAPASPRCARPAGWSGSRPGGGADDARRRRAQPARRPRARRRADRGVPLHAGWSACSAVMRDKDAARHPGRAGAGARRGRRHRELVAARDGPRRAGRGWRSRCSAPTG